MWRLCLTVVILATFSSNGHCLKRPKRQSGDADAQPRVITQNGHLYFQTGSNHNISFMQSQGGFINVGGEDLLSVVRTTKNNKQGLDELRAANIASRLQQLETSLQRLDTLNDAITQLTARVNTLENQPGTGDIEDRVRILESRVQELRQLLNTNDCRSSPCRNGGTCVDQYNGFFCKCPDGWKGPNCQDDVDECVLYEGTALGCHHGATCYNSPGSYTCHCPPNAFGPLCNLNQGACVSGSRDLCGHGLCIPDGSSRGFTCQCDDGWTLDSEQRCEQDVNECANTQNPPCSINPPVLCINTPGSYVCGPCPSGYSGPGSQCFDINECLENNGGCSVAPRVTCINTPGSRQCGACPGGYQGDGVTCTYVGLCPINNGGCHPLATCREVPGTGVRTCQCPAGYVGNGEGINGCVLSGGTPPPGGFCRTHPCLNGRCSEGTNTFVCTCDAGWTGTRCNTNINECASNPCQNGGTCTDGVNGYQCTCTSDYTGTYCQTARETCGGALRGESGELRYPRTVGDTYPHNLSCAWTITTTRNKILMIRFVNFHLEGHSTCNYDFLQIHDGPSASSYQIGKYCGTTVPSPFNSTHNQLYMWFRSDHSVTGNGFHLFWTTADPVCGGDIRDLPYGSIKSPGHPGNYPHNRDCVWTIAVEAGKNIQFTFATIDIETHENCSYDYLEIRNGLLDTDDVLTKICSSQTPAPLKTRGPEAWIKFHTDSSESAGGFHITWHAEQAAAGCGGHYTAESGVLISPNYPNPYEHDAECVWTIEISPETESIYLTFTNLEIESHSWCGYDFVEVRDGIDETADLVGRYCGTQVPAPYTSSSNQLYVRFKTDYSQSGSGFRATWEVACGGTFTEPTGELQSPYHPDPYPNNKECMYNINVASNKAVRLTFVEFDVEGGLDGNENCEYDFVKVFNGGSTDATVIGTYCGAQIPSPVTSTGNSMTLKFKSDGSQRNYGFRATYETIDPEGCNAVFTDPAGSFTSPGHPNNYPHGVNCRWVIQAEPGLIIRLTFTTFRFESHSSCRYDYVEVFDNSTDGIGGSLGKFCGQTMPPSLTTRENMMTIIMKTDGSVAHSGFAASYVTMNATTSCGGELQLPTGLITSPNWPGNYLHQRECVWTIIVPNGRQIRLNTTDFELESHPNCNYDFLEIRNGGYITSPLIGKYCGTTIDREIVSHSNRLYIRFKTDASESAPGFRIWYDGTTTGCGGQLTTPSGSFMSPNYPLPYGHNAECYWRISVARGSIIQLMYLDLNIEAHANCNYDYVQVFDGNSQAAPVLAKSCGTDIPPQITSSGSELYVKFRTDYSNAGSGFHAAYQSSCSDIALEGRGGVIESPNYPNPYPHNRDCSWIIHTDRGNQVNVTFTDFKLEYRSSCSADYLEVCEMRRLLACNTLLQAPQGVIESPNFPLAYPNNRDCTWLIHVYQGNRIDITFSHFSMEDHSDCLYDYLEVRDGQQADSPLIGRFCNSSVLPGPITSSSDYLHIRFVSDYSIAGNGFRLEWVINGCGGDLTGTQGTFTSPNYPANYPHNRMCVWTITVPINSNIQLTVSDIDLEQHQECVYDSLTMYEGTTTNLQPLAQLCHQQNDPLVVTSNGNRMTVQFKSDGSSSGRGFTARYTALSAGCGGNFSTPSGTIMSKNFPNSYPHSSDCAWLITLPEGRIVQFTFSDMRIESAPACRYDYVALYDGPDDSSLQIGKFCNTSAPSGVWSSSSNQMYIRFVSDGSVSYLGFRGSYATGCGGRLSAETDGEIMSPNYPEPYDANHNCSWVITTDSSTDRIFLTFTHMDLEAHTDCLHDYVLVANGDNADAPVLGRYCGRTVPPTVTSLGNSLYIAFVSDGSIQGRGFRATFTKSVSTCGGDFTSEHGAFNSPGFPMSYPNNVECIWTISASPGNRIQLTFSMFQLEAHHLCNYDFLTVRDGGPGGDLVGRFCGNTIPANITASNVIWMRFRSNAGITGRGFQASYNSCALTRISLFDIQPPTDGSTRCTEDYVLIENMVTNERVALLCGRNPPAPLTSANLLRITFRSDNNATGQGFSFTYSSLYGGDLSGNTGQVASPLYPAQYPHNANYRWTITVPVNRRVKITFSSMDMESASGCDFDYVKFLDGGQSDAPEIGRFCGTELPAPFITSSNQVFVHFYSDYSSAGTGFLFTWQATSDTAITPSPPTGTTPVPGCGGDLVAAGTMQQLQSPGYPGYANGLRCMWVIRSDAGTKVYFNITTIYTESSASRCRYDFVAVYDGDSVSAPLLGKFCGRVPNLEPIISSSNVMLVSFITDGSVTRRGFQANYKTACGGFLQTTQGVIKSPNYPNNYDNNANCSWKIQVLNGRTIQLTFDAFTLQGTQGRCGGDYLQVRNGGDPDSPPLGCNGALTCKFCGSSRPTIPASSSSLLWINFVSDGSGQAAGFQITYREVAIECGDRLTLTNDVTSGIITSPNYPENTPHNVDCTWVITAPGTEAVQLDFSVFNIENHGQCRYDYVEVRDGGTENSALIGRYCGNAAPGTLRSTDNVMYIRFVTDNSVTMKGFQATYAISTCGGTINADSGSIQSPNYPSNYDHNADCMWYINGPTGHFLTLTFESFALQGGSGCSNDFLEIRNRNGSGTLLGRFCGTTKPQPVRTPDSHAFIRFVSDSSVAASGFKVNFQASVEGCGGTYTTPTGTITSPNYPNLYPHSRRCTYKITVQPGRRIKLVINDIQIEEHASCLYDALLVRNGILEDSPTLAKLCGNNSTAVQPIYSSQHTMTVVFITDGSVSNGGFSASYSSDEAEVCGGSIFAPASGTIQSPGFAGGNYSNNLQCIWLISTPARSNASISLTFSIFNLEYASDCRYDYVEVREGVDETGHLIGRFCGNTTMSLNYPKSIVSPWPAVWINFHTDVSIVNRGFQLSYSFPDCGGVLSDFSGFITSPNYPGNYPSSIYCGWMITAPEGHNIVVQTEDFDVDGRDKCKYANVTVLNGGSASSPAIGHYCGSDSSGLHAPNFRSMTNHLRVTFHSILSAPKRGFKIRYSVDNTGCGGVMHTDDGYLATPNHPNSYPHNTECVWDIVVSTGYRVVLTFNPPFEMEDQQNTCTYDYMEASDFKNGEYTPLLRACGHELPPTLTSSGSRMRVKFRSDPWTNANGFSANWTTGCGNVYYDETGIISSPGFPGEYGINLTCAYVIVGEPGEHIVVQFTAFNLEAGSRCQYDAVSFYQGNDTTQPSIGRFCGTTIPGAVTTEGVMTMLFTTDHSIQSTGFSATYRKTRCGGELTDTDGTIRSPTNPANYLHNSNCTWVITVAQNRVVELKFNEFHLESHGRCIYDYVEIRDGADMSARSLGRFCGNAIPPLLRSTGNQMLLMFVTDSSVSFGGFVAAYRTTYGVNQGCGGVLNMPSGTIGSIDSDFDGVYENQLNCTWTVMVADNKVARLAFTSFALEPHSSCDYDFVEVRDGIGNADVLGRFCGSSTPTDILSSSNAVTIQFFTDATVGARGFNMTFTSVDRVCGGAFMATAVPQTITSPNYPGNYGDRHNCRWSISAPESKMVKINVTDFSVEHQTDCNYDYLEFRDVPRDETRQLIHYCGTSLPPVFYSSGRDMQIKFVTDRWTVGKGFSLTYQIASCNRTYTSDNGRLTSPGWPGNYPSNANCETVVRAPVGNRISVYFNSLFIEAHARCQYDYLEIRNGDSITAPVLTTVCGRTLPDPVFGGNALFMRFITDNSVTHSGYDITFSSSPSGCGGNFTGIQGSFTSPGYPGNYPASQVCEYLITVPARRRITMQFTAFDLHATTSRCQNENDLVEVRDGSSASSRLIGVYCGTDSPATATSSSRYMYIRFLSDGSGTSSGFRATYTTGQPLARDRSRLQARPLLPLIG